MSAMIAMPPPKRIIRKKGAINIASEQTYRKKYKDHCRG